MSAALSLNANIYTPSLPGALRQGEIISNLRQSRLTIETLFDLTPKFVYEEHPFAIVVSQDCDLEQDYNLRQNGGTGDKRLPNVLFCQMTSAQGLRDIKDDGLVRINSRIWDQIKINKSERYHFFQQVILEQDALHQGLPELVADFKLYFTLPTDEVYERLKNGAQRRCTLLSPYLEHLSTRFSYYQYRVALPSNHSSLPA